MKLRILVPIMIAWPPTGQEAMLALMQVSRSHDNLFFNRLVDSANFVSMHIMLGTVTLMLAPSGPGSYRSLGVAPCGVYYIRCEGKLDARESKRKEARRYAREDDHDGGFLRTAG